MWTITTRLKCVNMINYSIKHSDFYETLGLLTVNCKLSKKTPFNNLKSSGKTVAKK